jgi:hypothetical protein
MPEHPPFLRLLGGLCFEPDHEYYIYPEMQDRNYFNRLVLEMILNFTHRYSTPSLE